jgi:hypothetical protein
MDFFWGGKSIKIKRNILRVINGIIKKFTHQLHPQDSKNGNNIISFSSNPFVCLFVYE